jgi:hypothetical protein
MLLVEETCDRFILTKKEAENRKGNSTMMIARNKLIRRRWNGMREAKFFWSEV